MRQQILITLDDLKPEKQQEFINEVEKATGESFDQFDASFEIYITVEITKDCIEIN